jgi:hypothetical protein
METKNNPVTDIFNLNLKTLESLHLTLEKIGDCDISMGLGKGEDGRPISWGEVLYAKYRLVNNLLRWVNVLLSDRIKFDSFIEKYKLIRVPIEKKKGNGSSYGIYSKHQYVYAYDPKVDEEIDNLVRDICGALQVTGIFKMKSNDPRNIAGR